MSLVFTLERKNHEAKRSDNAEKPNSGIKKTLTARSQFCNNEINKKIVTFPPERNTRNDRVTKEVKVTSEPDTRA